MDRQIAVGVLNDGSVIVAGGDADTNRSSHLSYRYTPRTNTWTRTSDLPEPQGWFFTPTIKLGDGRLLAAGGLGADAGPTGIASRKAFVFDGNVPGKWDYTRAANDRSVCPRLGAVTCSATPFFSRTVACSSAEGTPRGMRVETTCPPSPRSLTISVRRPDAGRAVHHYRRWPVRTTGFPARRVAAPTVRACR